MSTELAWDTAETNCTAYLNTVLGTTLNVDGFRAELPRVASAVTSLAQWAFAITGGNNLHFPDPAQRGQVTSWHNEALWEGRYTDRTAALTAIGKLRAALPAGSSDISGVQKLYIAAQPTVQRAVVELDNDLSAGGGLRVWLVTIPMAVAYNS